MDCLLINERLQAYDSATTLIEGRKLGNATHSMPFQLSSFTATSDLSGNILAIGGSFTLLFVFSDKYFQLLHHFKCFVGWSESWSRINENVFSLNTHSSSADMTWENHSRVPPQCCFSAATTTIHGDIILTGRQNDPC